MVSSVSSSDSVASDVDACVNLKALVVTIVQVFADRCASKHIKAHAIVEDDCPVHIACSGLKLPQILLHLLQNAVQVAQCSSCPSPSDQRAHAMVRIPCLRQATTSGRIEVVVSPAQSDNGVDATCPLLLFQVHDTGRGLSDDEQRAVAMQGSPLAGSLSNSQCYLTHPQGSGLLVVRQLVRRIVVLRASTRTRR